MKSLITLFISVMLLGCGKSYDKEADKQLKSKPEVAGTASREKLASDFSLPDLNGNTVSLKDFRDKPVLLLFWASWCPSCTSKIPLLNNIYTESSGKFSIVAVSVDKNLEKLKRFAKKNNILYKVLIDKKAVAAKLYGVVGIPAHYVVDKNGYSYFFGADIKAATAKIHELLSE